MDNRKILKIFLGSPSDLADERKEAHEVVERFNRHLGQNLGIFIDLRGWEDTLPGSKRPQEIINKDVRSCDIFVGIVWKRWGTPTGEYSSGFEEEYNIAKSLKENNKLKDIWIFFKEIPEDSLIDPGDQLKKVIAFKNQIHAENKLFYKSFKKNFEWSKILYDYLSNYVTQEEFREESFPEELKKKQKEKSKLINLTGSKEDQKPSDISDILIEAATLTKGDKETNKIDDYHRIRMLVFSRSLISDSHIDDKFLGNHEIHLLYLFRSQVKLHPIERKYIFRSIILDENSLKTGWFWYQKITFDYEKYFLAIVNSNYPDSIRVYALENYSKVAKHFNFEELKSLLDDSSEKVQQKIIDFYEKIGTLYDIKFLIDRYNNETSEIAKRIWETIVAIYSRENADEAINFIINSPEKKHGWAGDYIEKILNNSQKSTIKLLFNSSSAYFKQLAFDEIKNILSDDEVKNISKSNDASLITSSNLELLHRGIEVDIEKIEKKLESVAGENSLSRALGLSVYKNNLDKIKIESFKRHKVKNLMNEIILTKPDSHLKYIAAIHKATLKDNRIIKNDILDNFKRVKDNTLEYQADLIKKYGKSFAEIFKDISKNEDYFIASLFNNALKALRIGNISNEYKLSLYLLNQSFSHFENEIYTNALRLYDTKGFKTRIEFLIKFSYKAKSDETKFLAVQIAFENAGKNTKLLIKSLLKHDSPKILKLVLSKIDKTQIHDYDNYLYNFLFHENDDIRMISLSTIIKNFKKKEVEGILIKYLSSKTYFYNVVCWLDRYLYCPKILSNHYKKEIEKYIYDA